MKRYEVPALLERAPRAAPDGPPTDWLRLPPASLQGALVAVVGRDVRSLTLNDAQRLSHFPSSQLVSLSWYRDTARGIVPGFQMTGRITVYVPAAAAVFSRRRRKISNSLAQNSLLK